MRHATKPHGSIDHTLQYGGKFDYLPWSATTGYRFCSCGNWHFEQDVEGPPAPATPAAFTPEPATDDEYAAFSAWAMPYVWSSDKAAMDLAYIAWRAGFAAAP